MTDPGSSMSLTAIIVLTVVVLVTMAGWLGTVFFVGRGEPGGGGTRPGGDNPGRASQPEAGRHSGAPVAPPGGDGGTLTRDGGGR